MKTFLTRLLLVLALFAPTYLVRAEDLGAVRARMSQRLSQIDEMKARGVVGENNRGFLEAREGGGDAGVIAAENKDRETVYAALAAQTNTSPEQVAKARARQIAQGSRPGVWVQDSSGDWKKK
jgi:uncharacterized protein